jgi:superoxide dismutase
MQTTIIAAASLCIGSVVGLFLPALLSAAGHINHDIFWTNLCPEKVISGAL